MTFAFLTGACIGVWAGFVGAAVALRALMRWRA